MGLRILTLSSYFTSDLREALRGKSRSELDSWFHENSPYLRADLRGKFVIDEEARKFGIPSDSPELIPAAIEQLSERGIRELLSRYVPFGPAETASVNEWRTWHQENQPYLFFSDSAGFHWYVDQLAKKRHVPTTKLRGTDRASMAP